jgi:predicted  nucleic acid-binding Zn-ribbon protein
MHDGTDNSRAAGSDGGRSPDPGQVSGDGVGRRAWVKSVALVGGGLVAGGILAGTLTAAAATDDESTSSPSTSTEETAPDAGRGAGGGPPGGPGGGMGNGDPSQPQRSDEELLTGDTATKVTDAVLAEYPDATIQRVETDSEGVYEAHIVTVDDEELVVQVGEDFTVTGTQSHGR